jgi:two-component system, OmpR family, sensor histidine kinase CssS
MAESPKNSTDTPVPWSDVVRFVRQLSHDLRNHLNAVELQSSFLNELAENAEQKAEIQRLRGMIAQLSGALQKLTTSIASVKLTEMSYKASEFVEDLQQKLAADFPTESASVDWTSEVGDEAVSIDPQLLPQAFVELFTNAFKHDRGSGAILASARIDHGRFVFTLREPKTKFENSTENWGRPLQRTSQGHYGLGLHRARAILEAHRGTLHARYDAPSFITTVELPLLHDAK